MLSTFACPENLTYLDENGLTQFHRAKFMIVNDFCEESSNGFLQGYNRILNDPQPYIPCQVDSFGGEIYALLGMLDLIRSSKKPFVTVCQTKAMSCGAVLLSAGTKGYRFASPRATILIHEAATELSGKTSDIINDARNIELLNDNLMEILAQNSNRPKKFYQSLVNKSNNADLYISASQAKEYGLIDHIGVPEMKLEIKREYSIVMNNATIYPNDGTNNSKLNGGRRKTPTSRANKKVEVKE
jgi:ATP-dependent Clp endopeptidase proteolytic subunit ClpP